jgi:hypothetical protein
MLDEIDYEMGDFFNAIAENPGKAIMIGILIFLVSSVRIYINLGNKE